MAQTSKLSGKFYAHFVQVVTGVIKIWRDRWWDSLGTFVCDGSV